MITVEVVLETYDAVDFTAWPIAEPSVDGLLALSGQTSPINVGTAMAAILSYNGITLTRAADLTETRLEQHLAEAESLIAPGGLRFHDTTTDTGIPPGCCFGLENWRDWWDVAHGQDLWLGHDPATHITHKADTIRLRQDAENSPTLETTREELSNLLTTAQQHFAEFLDLTRQWAETTLPGPTAWLTTSLDRHFKITSAEQPNPF